MMIKPFAVLIAALAPATLSAQDLPDRPIQRSEVVAAAKAQFQKLDANHDGTVTRGEFEAYRAKQAAAGGDDNPFTHVGSHWFDHADPDGTGRVTLQQAEQRPLKMFDMADMNHDGVVSPNEARIALALRNFGK
jgi:Ca2+-binding EF-hand superfamily protein